MSEPILNFRLFDTHSHINDRHFDEDREELIERLRQGDPEYIVEVGTTLDDSKKAVELSEENYHIYSAVGIHPYEINELPNDYIDTLKKLAESDKVVAIGEIGLDYYRDYSPEDRQLKCLVEQLELAVELDLPVIFHVRDAYPHALKIAEDFSGRLRAVVHAYGGTFKEAKSFLKLGYSLGIGGTLTFKKNDSLREIVRKIPLNSILTETDCPYLTPVPYRGRRNEPSYVRYVVQTIAKEKGLDILECSERLFKNAMEFFSIENGGLSNGEN